MPPPRELAHRHVANTALPYKSNVNPTDTDPCFVTGSQDLLTSIAGYCERRPGFADNVEVTPTTFNNLKRLFTWNRNDGTTFIEMACDVNASGQAVVYKRVVGTDNSFTSIYTDTGSNTPFDFKISNNTVYFSNGHVAKAWDPVNGIRNWGIAIGSVNNATGPNAPSTASDGGEGGTVWTNPGNVTAQDAVYATTTNTGGSTTNSLTVTGFGFSIPASTIINGILVEIKGFSTGNLTANFDGLVSVTGVNVQLLKGGSVTGGAKSAPLTGSNAFVSSGGTSDLWGSTWTANDINQSNFGIKIPSQSFTPVAPPIGYSGSQNISLDFVRITVYGTGGPTVSLLGGGSLTASIGYQEVFCYGNSATGHISSPTPVSAQIKPTAQNIQVSLTASTDPQVNQIKDFRTTDSVAAGTTGSTFFEISNSPFANSTANITDSTADTALNAFSVAPTPGFNDPPTPGRGIEYFAGRMWLFSGNKLYFSALEECINGVPEESFVSGIAGNFWTFDQLITGLAVAGSGPSQVLLIFCPGRIYGITGTSLDTFRRFQITNRRGCRNLTCIGALGGMVAWLDSSNQIWAMDGSGNMEELSRDIRPDIKSVTPANCCLTFHVAGTSHWLVFSTGSKLLVYDMDTEQWMPPWSFACQYLHSGETSAGTVRLMAATSTKALMLSTTAHNDNAVNYTPIGQLSFFSLVPDYGKRFSYIAAGSYDEPSRTGYPAIFQVDTNSVSLADVSYAVDEDPLNANTAYLSIFKNITNPKVAFNRGQGTNIVQNVFPMNSPTARWISFQMKGKNADDALKMYDWFLAYKQTR